MSADGSPYTRFQRALDSGQLTTAMSAAAELPRVHLDDALRLCLMLREEPDRDVFQRAAVRWVSRFLLEAKPQTIAPVRAAAAAFESMPERPDDAMETLAQLCIDYRLTSSPRPLERYLRG